MLLGGIALAGRLLAALPPLAGDGVADDTAAIQARLDSGASCVYLPPPAKCYLISKTLKIGSEQELRLDRFSVVRLAPKSDCPMVENRGYVGGSDRRIAITGGIWDMANLDQSPNPQQYGRLDPPKPSPMPKRHENGFFFGMAMRFSNVEGMTVRGVTVRNPTSYGIAFCKTSYFLVDDVTFDYTTWNPIPLNLDGVHFDGHCHHGKISNLRGTCFDDLVALNANDGQCAQEEGAITDVDIDGVYADYCHSAVRMLSTGAELKRVTVRNVHGNFYTYAVGLTHFFPKRPRGCFDDIVISDVFAAKLRRHRDLGRVRREGVLAGGDRRQLAHELSADLGAGAGGRRVAHDSQPEPRREEHPRRLHPRGQGRDHRAADRARLQGDQPDGEAPRVLRRARQGVHLDG